MNTLAALAIEGGVEDPDVICAALLHDTIEDTKTTKEKLIAIFGDKVTSIVLGVTDDKSLNKSARQELQIHHASQIALQAKFVKLADKIFNLQDILK